MNVCTPLLNELCSFSKCKLRPTTTKIYYLSGKQFESKSNDPNETEIEAGAEEAASADLVASPVYRSRQTDYLVDIVPDMSIDQIVPRIYLSGDDVALNRSILNQHEISHIVNLTTNIPNAFESEIKYLKNRVAELPDESIERYFGQTFEFIDEAMSTDLKNKVLVHCNAGVPRSSTIVIAYLLKKKHFSTLREAFDHVKAKRSKICPNNRFIKSLIEFESQL